MLLAVPPARCACSTGPSPWASSPPPCPTWPHKGRRLGYKTRQGYVTYQILVHCGSRKRPVPQGVTYVKPVHHGVNQLKSAGSLQSAAEERAGRHCGAESPEFLLGW